MKISKEEQERVEMLKKVIKDEMERIKNIPEFVEHHKFAKDFALTSYLFFLEPKINKIWGLKGKKW